MYKQLVQGIVQEDSSKAFYAFGLDKAKVVKALHDLADEIEQVGFVPQTFTRVEVAQAADFTMIEVKVKYAVPVNPSCE